MQDVSPVSNQTSLPLPLYSARTLFAARPTDPPSSPPPTSPLPPLPEVAPYEGQKRFPTFRDALSNGQPVRSSRPPRPPRPTTSLPDLKPRTITSPEIYRRQRSIELAAQVKYCPAQQRRPIKSHLREAPPEIIQPCNLIRLPVTAPQSSSIFSDDVLSALPKFFQRSPLNSGSGSEHLRAWQVYHRSSITHFSKSTKRKTDTKEPIIRTALFIPKTPPGEPDWVEIHYPSGYGSSPQTSQWCYAAQSRNIALGILYPPRHSSKTALTGSSPTRPPSPSHKRSRAVTSFTFDFGNYNGSQELRLGSYSSDANLTALPKLLPTQEVHSFASLQCTSQGTLRHSPHPYTKDEYPKRTSYEAIAFASLPYAHTIHIAGPRPKTEEDLLDAASNTKSTGHSLPHLHNISTYLCFPCSTSHPNDFHSVDPALGVDLQSNEDSEEQRGFTEEEIRIVKRKRFLWIIATISLVLMATMGILGGIISKLTHVGRRP